MSSFKGKFWQDVSSKALVRLCPYSLPAGALTTSLLGWICLLSEAYCLVTACLLSFLSWHSKLLIFRKFLGSPLHFHLYCHSSIHCPLSDTMPDLPSLLLKSKWKPLQLYNLMHCVCPSNKHHVGNAKICHQLKQAPLYH